MSFFFFVMLLFLLLLSSLLFLLFRNCFSSALLCSVLLVLVVIRGRDEGDEPNANLRFSAGSCGFLRFPAKVSGFMRNLRFPNALFLEKARVCKDRGKSAQIRVWARFVPSGSSP